MIDSAALGSPACGLSLFSSANKRFQLPHDILHFRVCCAIATLGNELPVHCYRGRLNLTRERDPL